ncbi:carbon-nitrogen hydrolase family protein [Brooklawnia cerclae]|uniref:Amidohydrolase n=1 Tax=Brooklawnia cerclae TaxID=349934 RepID=A0ABX0SIS6_9ACTN|nr:carbon-nitrogen hydrolase family protein [Brooklawnia cerclae]NIH56647.1 putative amidohydrolase [Brooklawnia cerclae]
MSVLRVAGGQFSPGENRDRNVTAISDLVRRATAAGAGILVLPEYASYFEAAFTSEFVRCSEPLEGPFVTAMQGLAERNGIVIVAGMNERVDGEPRFHNTLVAVGAPGLLGVYRKVHLFDAFGHRESDLERPGDPAQAVVIDVDGVRVGLQTCYDLRFPESTRRLADADAQLVVVPAQWVPGPLKEHHWATLLAARAIENTSYVLGVGQSAPNGTGRSMLVDPMGVVLAGVGTGPGLLIGEVDPAELERTRTVNPALGLRRLHVEPGAPGAGRPTAG